MSLIQGGHPERASLLQNGRIRNLSMNSREGTSVAFTGTTGKVPSMYNWISPTDQHLIYQDGTVAKRRKLSDGTTDSLVTGLTTTRALVSADLGPRVYFCGFDTSDYGTIQCRIYDGLYTSAVPNVDKAFAGPLTFTAFTPSDGGVGQCTKGTHKLGFVFQSRSGFSGKPSPVVSSTFTPASITLNAQQRIISISITLNTPADAGTGSAIYPIMTRADNPNAWFFVPGVFAILPASTAAWTQVFTISVSDEDLANRAESADNQFNFLTQDGSGLGPFTPQAVVAYGKRMSYVVGNKVYMSDIDNPQALTEDFNVVQMPSQRLITTAFQFGQDYFIIGDRWTGRTSDNGDVPATWTQPKAVSDSIGTTAIHGVEWRTAGPWIWIASQRGLEYFDGQYQAHPVSYYNSDIWARINWAAAYAIQVVDDTTKLQVHVAVPLDGATEPTHDLVFDYTNGKTYETCDFSMDNFANGTFSSLAIVKDATTARTSVYVGPSAAGRVLKLDNTTGDDINATTGAAAAVHGVWKSGYCRKPGEVQAKTLRVGNADYWLRGNGTPTLTWTGLDNVQSVTPALMSAGCTVVTNLSSAPGQVYSSKFDLSPVENYFFKVETNAVGAWFSLSAFTPYYKPALWTR